MLKKLALTLTFLSLAGCATPATRSPSSSETGEDHFRQDVTLQSLVGEPDPRAAARALVERLLRIRVRAQAYLEEFDRDLITLQEGQEIFSLPSYRRLLAARPIAERTEEKIVAIYKESRELTMSADETPAGRDKQDKALLVTAGIRDALREIRKEEAKRVLLQDLMQAMRESFGADLGAEDLKTFGAPFGAVALGVAAQHSRGDILTMVQGLPDSDDVKAEIERDAEELPVSEAGERGPSAAAHFPTAAPPGNLMGFDFPKGTYALTYDDGPHATLTMANLRNLQETGTKATFFWLANNGHRYPSIVKQVKGSGYPIANHSYMHAKILVAKDLARLNTTPEKEIFTSTDDWAAILGEKPKYFRLPYAQGFDNPRIRQMIASRNMIHVKWNIDSADWQDKNPASVLARVEAQMQQNGRGIILFHDIQPGTVAASRNLMQKYKGKVRWVTIPEIVDELNKK